MNDDTRRRLSKVPEVTLIFWIIKIAATTLGETGGDSVTMTLNWGYLVGTAIFLSLPLVFVALQIIAKKFHPFLYWSAIVASTTFGLRWPTLRIVRWASVIQAVPRYDSLPDNGPWHLVLVRRDNLGEYG
jgi:uncharacterized membrane-anchored protein